MCASGAVGGYTLVPGRDAHRKARCTAVLRLPRPGRDPARPAAKVVEPRHDAAASVAWSNVRAEAAGDRAGADRCVSFHWRQSETGQAWR